jgi:hypothetical protein
MYPALQQTVLRRRYRDRVLRIQRPSLVAYLPLGERAGAVAIDASGNGRNGASTAVALGHPGPGGRASGVLLDGSTSYINWYSTSLRDAFNNAEGSLVVWCKVPSAVWTDGASHTLCRLRADANNSIDINKSTTNNRVNCAYLAGSTNSQVQITSITSLDWLCFGLTWSKAADQVIGYMNGVQQGATLTGLGVWAGNLASGNTVVGAATLTPTGAWNGHIAHAALWSTPLTAAEMLRLGVV